MNINLNKHENFLLAFFLMTVTIVLPVSCQAQTASEIIPTNAENKSLQDCRETKVEFVEPRQWKENALHTAILNLDAKKVRKLLAEKTSVDEIAGYGDTALVLALRPRIPEAKPVPSEQRKRDAAKENTFRLEAVKELLKYNADPNKKGIDGMTPIIETVRRNYQTEHQLKILNLLTENKADVNLQDNRGMSALMWAAENGNVKVVNFLIKHGANRELKNCQGQTALLIARSTDKVKIVQTLENVN